MPVSQNGYSANDINVTSVERIPGTSRYIRLRKGDTGWLLRHLASWFDRAIESIDSGQLDDWGYAERPIRGDWELSNHASGTAIDLNSLQHPIGVRYTFNSTQRTRIRRRLRFYQGAIRWGGDYNGRVDEMHFEIDKSYAYVQMVVRAVKAAEAAGDRLPRVSLSRVQQQARAGGPDALIMVKRVQRALNARYRTALVADGHFGPNTRDVYKRHQTKLFGSQDADGIPGEQSLKNLGRRRFRVVR